MQIYNACGHYRGGSFADTVVAKNEEHVKQIIEERYGILEELEIYKRSKEDFRVSSLTVGDLERLIRGE